MASDDVRRAAMRNLKNCFMGASFGFARIIRSSVASCCQRLKPQCRTAGAEDDGLLTEGLGEVRRTSASTRYNCSIEFPEPASQGRTHGHDWKTAAFRGRAFAYLLPLCAGTKSAKPAAAKSKPSTAEFSISAAEPGGSAPRRRITPTNARSVNCN